MDPRQHLKNKYSSPSQPLAGNEKGEDAREKNFKPEPEPPERRKALEELARLLRGVPIVIVNTADEFGLDARSRSWQFENQALSFRIAELVFGPLFDFLHRHPASRITARNIMATRVD